MPVIKTNFMIVVFLSKLDRTKRKESNKIETKPNPTHSQFQRLVVPQARTEPLC